MKILACNIRNKLYYEIMEFIVENGMHEKLEMLDLTIVPHVKLER